MEDDVAPLPVLFARPRSLTNLLPAFYGRQITTHSISSVRTVMSSPNFLSNMKKIYPAQKSAGIMAKPSEPVQSVPSSRGPSLPLTAFLRTVAKQEPHGRTLHHSLPESCRQVPTVV